MFYGIKAVLVGLRLALTEMFVGPIGVRVYSRSRYTPHQGLAECQRRRARSHAYPG